jgi:outer membrane protein assembly factor BamD
VLLENTFKALESLQLYVNLYPESEKIEECNGLIDLLRAKLELKSYEAAKLYYNIGEYKSAVIAFENSINDYPDSKYREEMEFLSIKSGYLYAKNSIASKQKERYELALGYYQEFIKDYPDSDFLNEAENIYDSCLRAIDEISKNKDNEYSNQ